MANSARLTRIQWLLAGCLGCLSSAQANTWTLTYEAPRVQNSTGTLLSGGTETFDARATGGNQTFTSNFGGSGVSGTYSGVQINAADIYGGAQGSGKYAVVFASSYTLTLNTPVNYFGYWLSALDSGNVITFYNGATMVGQFNAGTVLSGVVTGNSQYYGNPTAPFLGADSGEPYAFVNFYSIGAGDRFDRIVISESTSGGYESDNHTVGLYATTGGTVVPGIPEPATYLLLGLGLAVVASGQKAKKPGTFRNRAHR